jgi:hypothetical protein
MGKDSLLEIIKVETGFIYIGLFVVALLWYLITINYIKRVTSENCSVGSMDRKDMLIKLYTTHIVIAFFVIMLFVTNMIEPEHVKVVALVQFIIGIGILFNVFKLLKEIDRTDESCANGIDKNVIKTLNYFGIFMIILQVLTFIGVCIIDKGGCMDLFSKHPATSMFFKERDIEQGCK